jgi:hypothetical protein
LALLCILRLAIIATGRRPIATISLRRIALRGIAWLAIGLLIGLLLRILL